MVSSGLIGPGHHSVRALVTGLSFLILLLALGLIAQPPAAFTQPAPAPTGVGAICHECEWLKIQIGDVDDEIAGWDRQIASINKYSNLADPNIQSALKDIDGRIAALKALKAELQAKLAECSKRCAAAKQTVTAPAGPVDSGRSSGATTGAGKTTGGPTGGGVDTDTGGPTGEIPPPPPVEPPPQCPAPAGPSVSAPDSNGAAGSGTNARPVPKIPQPPTAPQHELPPAPTNPFEDEDWEHLLWHMEIAESPAGDDDDVWDVIDDLDVSIGEVLEDLDDNPDNLDAEERLNWLRAERDYYEGWQAYIRYARPRLEWIAPYIRDGCPQPWWTIEEQPRQFIVPAPAPLNDFNPNAPVPYNGSLLKGVLGGIGVIPPPPGQRNRRSDDSGDQQPNTNSQGSRTAP